MRLTSTGDGKRIWRRESSKCGLPKHKASEKTQDCPSEKELGKTLLTQKGDGREFQAASRVLLKIGRKKTDPKERLSGYATGDCVGGMSKISGWGKKGGNWVSRRKTSTK